MTAARGRQTGLPCHLAARQPTVIVRAAGLPRRPRGLQVHADPPTGLRIDIAGLPSPLARKTTQP
jgi:hypothetical protein